MEHNLIFHQLFISFLLIGAGIYLLFHSKTISRNFITNNTIRRNVVALLVIELFFWALAPIFPDLMVMIRNYGMKKAVINYSVVAAVTSLIVYNIAYFVTKNRFLKKHSFLVHQLVLLLIIIGGTICTFLPVNYYFNNYSTKNFSTSMAWSFYFGSLVGIINFIINYILREKNQKEELRQLELVKLNELRVKAELESLQSKINPHFLYNSLNSIADLTTTDSQKAREMTLALSDLFRYSINYNGSNFCTVKDELAMVATYLQIERLRFENKLAYELFVSDEAKNYLLPRLLLQPLVENGVKHGLKNIKENGFIKVSATLENNYLQISITDNGPAFPDELTSGYGIKHVVDKLELIYPDAYELSFANQPQKQILITIKKLQKYEQKLESGGDR